MLDRRQVEVIEFHGIGIDVEINHLASKIRSRVREIETLATSDAVRHKFTEEDLDDFLARIVEKVKIKFEIDNELV